MTHVLGRSAVAADIEWMKDLARRGELADRVRGGTEDESARLLAALYSVVWPIVFGRVTRPVEQGRGHFRCAARFELLADDCLDRFHDDAAAVVDRALAKATVPIASLEAWLAGLSATAIVDAYRRRRGERGAPQRPRLPKWLVEALDDPWLGALALRIMEWVGVPATAGIHTWPLGQWAELRGQLTGDWAGSTEDRVAAEVDAVLAVMGRQRRWYDQNIEVPLGRKQAPTVAVAPRHVDGVDHPPLSLGEPGADADILLTEAASAAVAAIEKRLAVGGEPTEAVREVLRDLFCDGETGGAEAAEWLSARLLDADAVEVLTAEVLTVLRDDV